MNVAVDISLQHHALIIGQAGLSVQQMMQRTGATIQFPNRSVSDAQHRGTVYISGTLSSVCTARHLLLVSDFFVLYSRCWCSSFLLFFCIQLTVCSEAARIGSSCFQTGRSLSTHANRQGVDISFIVCLCNFFVSLYGYGFLCRS